MLSLKRSMVAVVFALVLALSTVLVVPADAGQVKAKGLRAATESPPPCETRRLASRPAQSGGAATSTRERGVAGTCAPAQ